METKSEERNNEKRDHRAQPALIWRRKSFAGWGMRLSINLPATWRACRTALSGQTKQAPPCEAR